MKELIEKEKNIEMEPCVVCHKPTQMESNMPIEIRKGYVRGFGQVCPQCAERFDIHE